MATISENFANAMDTVTNAVIAENSLYEKTLQKFDDYYTNSGISKADKYKLMAEISAQLAVSISSKAIDTAYAMAKGDNLLDKELDELQASIDVKTSQKKEIDKSVLLKQRQIDSFNDKLKVEIVKARKDVTAMEATQGDELTTLDALNTAINNLTPSA